MNDFQEPQTPQPVTPDDVQPVAEPAGVSPVVPEPVAAEPFVAQPSAASQPQTPQPEYAQQQAPQPQYDNNYQQYQQPPQGQYQQQPYGQPQYGQPPYGQPQPVYAPTSGKDRTVAGILAILLGSLGIHKFYLGYKNEGLIMLLVAVIGACVTLGIATIVMEIIGIIEGVMYLTKSQQEFDQIYVYNHKGWF
ncbi:MAG: NINE protein [Coriobacteriales bacterium]|jgi:TM2 domain-containing membrane protein YozV|nr:NINE protein [Coriobacteriales bacterium]